TKVRPDGTWELPNVPANFGPVRARATCVEGGVTTSGESDLFNVPANGTINLPGFDVGSVHPIPVNLQIFAATTTVGVGTPVQLAVIAVLSNGSGSDVTRGATGTVYTVSNSRIATVSGDGLVTGVSSGSVVVFTLNDGAPGMIRFLVTQSGDSDG